MALLGEYGGTFSCAS